MRMSVRKMAIAGVLGAVSVVMGLVPFLGFIPLPTGQNATIMHVPVIIAAVAEGPGVGMFVGFIFGLMSWLRADNAIFKDILIAMGPRLLIGAAAAYSFRSLRSFGLVTALAGSAVIGTLTNTVLVLGLIYLRGYLPGSVVLTLGLTHGVAELALSVVVVVAVGLALHRAGFVGRADSRSRKAA